MGGHVKREILVHTECGGGGGTVGKRQLGRLSRRMEDNIRMGVKVTVGLWKVMNWINLAQDTDKCWSCCEHNHEHGFIKTSLMQIV